MSYETPHFVIEEVIDSSIILESTFKNNKYREDYWVSISSKDNFIIDDMVIVHAKGRHTWINLYMKEHDFDSYEDETSSSEMIDEALKEEKLPWEIHSLLESDNKENNLSLKSIQESINNIIWDFTGYADFIFEDNPLENKYEWSNGQTGYKPKMEDGFYGVIVNDIEGNEKKYSRIKFPEYINDLEKLNQLYKARNATKERIKEQDINIRLFRNNLPKGEYNISIADSSGFVAQELDFVIESDKYKQH